MKNFILLLIIFFSLPNIMVSQTYDQQLGLFAIPNMSTSFVRMPSRESSQEIDAVYSNPAGLISLDNGLHFQANNQFQFIRKQTTTYYKEFNEGKSIYDFKVDNFVFPTVFVVWKKNNIAFSGGLFAAMGGGGGSSFPNLPSAELGIADMKTAISTLTKLYEQAYSLSQTYSDIDYQYAFESKGFAFSPGVQAGATYRIGRHFSVYGGLRYIRYIGVAEGGASDIEIKNNSTGEAYNPVAYLEQLYENEKEVIDKTPLLQLGDIVLEGGPLLEGVTDLIGSMFTTGDTDVKQTGVGFTPIVGLQYDIDNKLYIAVKYEHRTKVELLTEVFNNMDADGRYINGASIRADLPAISSVGIRYKINDKVKIAFGNRVAYFKSANANGKEKLINRNHFELTSSAEYQLSKKIAISAGYTYAKLSVDDAYQSEIDYAMPAHTFALGAQYRISNNVIIEGGWMNTLYVPQSYLREYELFQGKLNLPNSFNKNIKNDIQGRVMLVSIGATLSLPNSSN